MRREVRREVIPGALLRRCGGKIKIIALVRDPQSIARYLRHLGLLTEEPSMAVPSGPRAPNGLKAGYFPDLSPQRTQRTQRRIGGRRARIRKPLPSGLCVLRVLCGFAFPDLGSLLR